jgi:hypothetical protein
MACSFFLFPLRAQRDLEAPLATAVVARHSHTRSGVILPAPGDTGDEIGGGADLPRVS